jgi:outer membrane protein assembly factor BamA
VVKATTVCRVLVLLLLLAHGAPLHGQQPDGAGAARIDRVRFSGIRALDPALVRAAIATRESRCRSVLLAPVCAVTDARWTEETAWLDPAQVERDEERIRSLYAAWGYPDAAVRGEVVPLRGGDVEVRFAIDEGEAVRVRSVEVRGLDAIPEPVALPDPLPLRAGEPFAEARVEATRRRIVSRLAELGYAFANIEVAPTDADPGGMVDVVVEVRPGRPVVFGPTVVLPGP